MPTDDLARALVVGSGVLLWVTGLSLLLCLPLPLVGRLLGAIAWTADVAATLRAFIVRGRGLKHLRVFADGRAAAEQGDGQWRPVALHAGSVVTTRFAWLRFRLPSGKRHAELFLADRTAPGAWHRFQLVRRLAGAGFGHPDGA